MKNVLGCLLALGIGVLALVAGLLLAVLLLSLLIKIQGMYYS